MPITSRRDGVDQRAALLPREIQPLFDDSFVHSCDLFEEYVFRLALDVFRHLGLEAACAEPATRDEVIARTGLDPRASGVPVDWILRELAAHGVLEARSGPTGIRYLLPGELPHLDAGAVRAAQERHDPRALPSFAIAALAAEHYPAVLRAEESGEQALFGAERMGVWSEYFSNDNPIYGVSNAIGAIACANALDVRNGAILELGGGLGSGALALCDRLGVAANGGTIGEYRFTELSIPFLRRAQKDLAGRYPSVTFAFARLDMNRSFSEAGVKPEGCALAYAVNALHVARDLAFTLGEIRAALAPGGALVFAECVRPFLERPVYVEFIFNLLAVFREPILVPEWRPTGGFLTPEQWTAALGAAGFVDVRFLPDIAAIRDAYPSFVVAAITARRA
jgi:SAM-dependent methyltransferase